MSGPRFLDHKGVRLAHRFGPGTGPLIVFLPGYMSDMTGAKAQAVSDHARANGRACLRLDYSGCGASGGDFLDGSIGRWTDDALALINHVWPAGKVVLVGSSMGGWIALLAGLALQDRLAGLVGIAAAPDFTVWGLTVGEAERRQLESQGYFTRPSDYGEPYRYSRALIADAPQRLLLDGQIGITAPVRLLHGMADDAVPWRLSLDIAARITGGDVQVRLIKDGDHRLSRETDIAMLIATVQDLL
ncbi:alpha/beta hydrolase [Sandarakinorhabdus cyanobacteriorum]|uniref:Palmitoyl-protein thioesterase ABHD10, mitochondrial n=1 Tax=Sandarakinorhabdus cyanobacteriorum TaxID=1981098 RepID=A0A255YCS6_9SPHN|nr:alpha/beta hydrolase [Sandarakinorhabdus cyanobacteriorum]OYQ27046.1 alpha/beta hydrolase [Sandarakinorhabdus cyanobacteriorum]